MVQSGLMAWKPEARGFLLLGLALRQIIYFGEISFPCPFRRELGGNGKE